MQNPWEIPKGPKDPNVWKSIVLLEGRKWANCWFSFVTLSLLFLKEHVMTYSNKISQKKKLQRLTKTAGITTGVTGGSKVLNNSMVNFHLPLLPWKTVPQIKFLHMVFPAHHELYFCKILGIKKGLGHSMPIRYFELIYVVMFQHFISSLPSCNLSLLFSSHFCKSVRGAIHSKNLVSLS